MRFERDDLRRFLNANGWRFEMAKAKGEKEEISEMGEVGSASYVFRSLSPVQCVNHCDGWRERDSAKRNHNGRGGREGARLAHFPVNVLSA